MKLLFAADHAGVVLKNELVAAAKQAGHEPIDLGPADTASVDYPDFAEKLCLALVRGDAPLGVLVCGSGVGMCITANKVRGVRAALCHSELEARLSRQHNDANVVCFGQRLIGSALAVEVMKAFVSGSFEGGRHAGRVAKIAAVEAKR